MAEVIFHLFKEGLGLRTPVDEGVDEEHDVALERQVGLVRHESVEEGVETHPLSLDELEVVHRRQHRPVSFRPVDHQHR